MSITTIEAGLDWINSRLKFNIRPGLVRIEALLKLLGNPERQLSMIHIAGTNGKGSTVAFVRSIFMAAGLKVASFTSPSIESFGERLAINGQPISDERLIHYVNLLQPLVAKLDGDERAAGITEFELITATAFQYFADEKVDLAVIEVGLGGLSDSTNVILPVVCGISTIGLDHVGILGKTLEEIAAQKAGIIKPGVPVVTGNILAPALKVIQKTAQKNQAVLYQFQRDYSIKLEEDEKFSFYSKEEKLPDLEKSLLGRHQAENAALAIELATLYAQKMHIELTEKQIRTGLRSAHWPARMEKLADQPLTILDGAHNVDAMTRLVENLQTEFADRKISIIFSAIITKDIKQMIKMLQTIKNSHLILTTFDDPRALNLADFQYLEAEGVELASNWQQAIADQQQADLLLITGSLYFSAQVRAIIKS